MSDDFPVRVEQRGSVAVWTIDRADRMNALSRATLLAFGKLAREAAANASVRAIVVTGAGDKAFCAGADLKERQGMTRERRARAGRALPVASSGRSIARPSRSSPPSTASRSAAGSSSRSCCDLRVAAAHAQLGLPGDVARHHPRRRRDAAPAAHRRRGAREGDDPARAAG